MRRSLLQGSKLLVAALVLQSATVSCGESTEQQAPAEVAVDTPAAVPIAAPVPDTPQQEAQALPDAPPPAKQGTEVRHSSEDNKLRDSIKKAKAKDKTPVNREIKHGSENDAFLDSLKAAKSKGKK
ncbi:MAG: hypothetical protein JNL72_00375 [Flavipsychrobacter sp.]|nr:hypothetical protein [Flavipsychrobacter sp.]